MPGLSICHEARAANDALGYLHAFGTPEQIRDGYRTIDPAFAARSSLPLDSATGVPFFLPSVIAGHVVGHYRAASVPDEECEPLPAPPEITLQDPPAPPDIHFSSQL